MALTAGRGEPIDWPDHCYLICATPRSGSTLLSELLRASLVMGEPREYLDRGGMMFRLARAYGATRADGGVRPTAYLRALVDRHAGGNGAFGIKLMYDHLAPFLPVPAFRSLARRSRYVWLRRRDMLAQAVSAALAEKRSQWHRVAGEQAPTGDPPYDRTALERAWRGVLVHDAGWRLFFDVNRIEPLTLTYEELLADTDGACRRVCAAVGIADPPPFSLEGAAVEPMSTAANREWIDRYRAELSLDGADAPSPSSSHSA